MIRQCLSIEQMRHLKGLGVDTNKANMLWIKPQEGVYFVHDPNLSDGEWMLSINVENDRVKALCEVVPTFTLQDILDKLPSYITYNDEEYQLQILPPCICYRYVNYTFDDLYYKNNVDILENAYKILCWVIENGYIRKEE